MAKIPDLQSTNVLDKSDEIILRQDGIDKRIKLDLSDKLSWCKQNEKQYKGEYRSGVLLTEGDVLFYEGVAWEAVSAPYTTLDGVPTGSNDKSNVNKSNSILSAGNLKVGVDSLYYQNQQLTRNLGEYQAGLKYSQKGDYAIYNDQVIITKDETSLPYTTQGSNPTTAPDADNVVPFTTNAKEWVNCFTATYVSPTTFKLAGDQTGQYRAGRKVRIKNNTPEYSFSTIKSVSYTTSETIVDVVDAVISTGIVDVCNSFVSPDSSFSPKDIPTYTNLLFDTVAEMKSYDIEAGVLVKTKGYYSIGDGGGTDYIISDSGVNNSVTVISLDNGRFAKVFNESEYLFDPLLITNNHGEYTTPSGQGTIVRKNNLIHELSFMPQDINTRSHKGLSAYAIEYPNENFGILTREAGAHWDDENGVIRSYLSTFGGRNMTWSHQATAQDVAGTDDRDAAIGYMSNGRVGIMGINNSHWSYSDDNGVSWSTQPTGLSTYVGFVDQIHPYPQGGQDAYIMYGINYQGQDQERKLTAIITTDNGVTWDSQELLTGLPQDTSEWTVTRIGDLDLWIATARQNVAGQPPVYYRSTDMINWTDRVEGGLALEGNPSTILYHEGYVYFMATFRNREWSNATATQAYKGKIVWSRTPAWKVVNGDLSDLDNINVLMSLDNCLGYFTFLKSPVSGKLHAVVATREMSRNVSAEWRKDFPMSSDLILITNEKVVHTERNPDVFIADSSDQTMDWVVDYDRVGGVLKIHKNNHRLHGDGVNTYFKETFKLPRGITWAGGSTDFNVQVTWGESNAATSAGQHQIRINNKDTEQFDLSFHTDTVQGSVNWVEVDINVVGRGYYSRVK